MEVPTGFIETEAHGFYIITRPIYLGMATELARRDPETILAEAPQPGPMEGRGPRVELPGEGGETIILKKQLRGGLYRRLSGDTYRDITRALIEIPISEAAWRKGVPVGQIAFGMAAPAGPGRLASRRRGYTAAIKLPGARNLMEWLAPAAGGAAQGGTKTSETQRRAALKAAAEAVRRTHDRGMKHGDLNLGNILVGRSERGEYDAWLIDHAHSEVGSVLRFKPRLDNLVRLYRSASKWLPEPDPRRGLREVVWFLRAYTNRERGEARRYLEAARRYRASLFMHRLSWKAAGQGGGSKVRPRSISRSGR